MIWLIQRSPKGETIWYAYIFKHSNFLIFTKRWTLTGSVLQHTIPAALKLVTLNLGAWNWGFIGYVSTKADAFNQLYEIDAYMHHTTLSLWCHLQQCPWDLGSAPAKTVGQGEVGGCTWRVQKAWLLLGLAVESPWLALGGPFLSSFAQMGSEKNCLLTMSSGHVEPAFWAVKLFSCSVEATIGQEPGQKLVRKWAWFESWICTGWLQWHC